MKCTTILFVILSVFVSFTTNYAIGTDTNYTVKSFKYTLPAEVKNGLGVTWNVPQLFKHKLVVPKQKNSKVDKISSINLFILKETILLITNFEAQEKMKKSIEKFTLEQCDSTLSMFALFINQSIAKISKDSLVDKGGSNMDYEVMYKNKWLFSVNQFYTPSDKDFSTYFTTFASYSIETGENLDIATMVDEKKTYYIVEAISSTVSDVSRNQTSWQNYAESLRDIYGYCKSQTKNQKELSKMFWNEVRLDHFFTPTHLVVWTPLMDANSILESDVLEVPLYLFSKALKPKYQKMFSK